jgi:Protein of unknown function (DUF1761)
MLDEHTCEANMSEITTNMNWLAVALGFVVAFALGWAWYGPLFGKTWAEGVGLVWSKDMKPTSAAMVMQAVSTFLLAWVVGVTAIDSKAITFLLIVLTIAALVASNGLWVNKSTKAIAIEVGYIVAMAAVMFVAQGIL